MKNNEKGIQFLKDILTRLNSFGVWHLQTNSLIKHHCHYASMIIPTLKEGGYIDENNKLVHQVDYDIFIEEVKERHKRIVKLCRQKDEEARIFSERFLKLKPVPEPIFNSEDEKFNFCVNYLKEKGCVIQKKIITLEEL